MIVESKSKFRQFLFWLIIGLIVLVAAGLGLYWRNNKANLISDNQNYIIPGVPYVGIYNQKDRQGYINNDAVAAAVSVSEYWNPGKTNFAEANSFFRREPGTYINFQKIGDYFEKFGGYNVSQEKLGIGELKKYINSNKKTPLILFLPISENQPLEIWYHPAKVLIGINEPERKLIMHDFWLGNNLEISFDDFNKLWERMRPDERNMYLVVRPENYKGILDVGGVSQSYKPRTETMQTAGDMFQNFVLAQGAQSQKMNDKAIEYFLEIKSDPNFEMHFPPTFKVYLYYEMAEAYLALKNFDSAIEAANQAIEINHDLDKPSGDWPGTIHVLNKPSLIDRASGPYRVLGDVYRQQKDFAKAKENYLKALDIMPANEEALQGLKLVELELAKGTK